MEDPVRVRSEIGAAKLVPDFLNRFKAVSGKSGANHVDAGKSFTGKFFHEGKRIGLKPLVAALGRASCRERV